MTYSLFKDGTPPFLEVPYSVPLHLFGYHAAMERDAVGLGRADPRRLRWCLIWSRWAG